MGVSSVVACVVVMMDVLVMSVVVMVSVVSMIAAAAHTSVVDVAVVLGGVGGCCRRPLLCLTGMKSAQELPQHPVEESVSVPLSLLLKTMSMAIVVVSLLSPPWFSRQWLRAKALLSLSVSCLDLCFRFRVFDLVLAPGRRKKAARASRFR